jgi:AmmeMemoRadiSam system protein A
MMELDDNNKKELLSLARRAIEEYVLRGKKIEAPTKKEFQEMRGAFVTLTINNKLRGCIGYVIPIQPLAKTIIDCAIAAAVDDPRFPPLKPKEVSQIQIEISLLSSLKKIKNIDEIEVGKHGIMITNGFNRGLLLPQVAVEYKWDKISFLEQTCIKAGLDKNAWKNPETVIEIFTADIFSEQNFS